MKGNFISLSKDYSDNDLLSILSNCLDEVTNNDLYKERITDIFKFSLTHYDRSLVTSKNISKNDSEYNQIREFITNWCKSYVDERNQPASKRSLRTEGEKDLALVNRVNSARKNDDKKTLDDYFLGHQLYMSAENTNGKLLEEFLSVVLEQVGWIWCAGTTILAVDFIKIYDNSYTLLQVKNKYNTENSSSNKIRVGKDIVKWNRLKKPSSKDPYTPIPNWNKLLDLIQVNVNYTSDQSKFLRDNLTEENYLNYIYNNTPSL